MTAIVDPVVPTRGIVRRSSGPPPTRSSEDSRRATSHVRFVVTASLRFPVHLRVRGLRHPVTERFANRVILSAARLLGVAAGTHLGAFRGRDGGYEELKARLDRAELLASLAWRVVGILQARLRKVPDRHRPHYSPAARFEILEIRSLLGWNQSRTAEQFLVADNTIGNWERDPSPESRKVGSLARPIPPVTRLSLEKGNRGGDDSLWGSYTRRRDSGSLRSFVVVLDNACSGRGQKGRPPGPRPACRGLGRSE